MNRGRKARKTARGLIKQFFERYPKCEFCGTRRKVDPIDHLCKNCKRVFSSVGQNATVTS